MRGLLVFASACASVSALALAVTVGGCARTSPVEVPLATGTEIRLSTTTWDRPRLPTIIAYQDGDGPWQPLADVETQTFTVTSARFGVMVACFDELGTRVSVEQRAVDEGGAVEVAACVSYESKRSIHGTVVGLGDRRARVATGADSASVVEAGAFALQSGGAHADVILAVGDGERRSWVTTDVAIVRDLDVASGAAVALDAAAAVPMERRKAIVEGLTADETIGLTSTWITSHGTWAHLVRRTDGSADYAVPPAAVLTTADRMTVSVSAHARDQVRRVLARNPGPAHRFVLPPAMGAVEVERTDRGTRLAWRTRNVDSWVMLSQVRPRPLWTLHWHVRLSAAWVRAAQGRWSLPDVSRLESAAELLWRTEDLDWSVTEQLGDGRAAGRSGTLRSARRRRPPAAPPR